MHDRSSDDWIFMAKPVAGNRKVSVEQKYFSEFDVTPFQALPTLQRPKATVENKTPVKLKFEPSDFLLKSHSFNRRADYQLESSMLVLDKKRQPRATAILASFVAKNDNASPPSYGDKELFLYTSELAETQDSFQITPRELWARSLRTTVLRSQRCVVIWHTCFQFIKTGCKTTTCLFFTSTAITSCFTNRMWSLCIT